MAAKRTVKDTHKKLTQRKKSAESKLKKKHSKAWQKVKYSGTPINHFIQTTTQLAAIGALAGGLASSTVDDLQKKNSLITNSLGANAVSVDSISPPENPETLAETVLR